MIRFLRDLRLVPIAVIASACLLVLKAADLMLDGDQPASLDNAPLADSDPAVIRLKPGVPQPSDPQRSWAQQMFNFPGGRVAPPAAIESLLPAIAPLAADKGDDIVTGAVGGSNDDKNAAKAKGEAAAATGKDGQPANAGKEGQPANAAKDGKPASTGKDAQPPSAGKDKPAANAGKGKPEAPPPDGQVIPVDGKPLPSAAERAVLERLTERRQELDKRARELDIREGLVAEAEKRIEARLAEIKQAQAQVAVATEKKDEEEAARFKSLVTMYENMKARDAAKIFDRLELSVLLEVASQINPRRMADILAQMAPESAERLTVELANRAKLVTKPGDGGNGALPKIEGHPTNP
jgi:flagellar motility protein MotE (MotC chaperone)